jgi:GNAT superfamily N-acetyltransferase
MQIIDAKPEHVVPILDSFASAFADDPLVQYLFRTHPRGIAAGARDFFGTLLRVRMALGMPARVMLVDDQIAGATMGYDTRRLDWPPELLERWNYLGRETPGLNARLAAYSELADRSQPAEPHYYLGVIGVAQAFQGRGVGKALLEDYCARSDADPLSRGVFLETSSPASLTFYLRNGFTLRGEGDLEGARLWCVFRPRR